MIDTVLLALPVLIIGIAAFRLMRYMPWTSEWKPPSSRLSLLGVASTLLLLLRFLTTHKPWYSTVFIVLANLSMIWAYRVAARSEARHREYQRRQEELGGLGG